MSLFTVAALIDHAGGTWLFIFDAVLFVAIAFFLIIAFAGVHDMRKTLDTLPVVAV
jgi:hypothetical protein